MKDPPYFLCVHNATVKFYGKVLFQDLNFTMKSGESWAILAGSGKEKTAFLETLLGRTSIMRGSIDRPFALDYQKEKSAQGKINSFRDLVAVVSQKYPFKNKSNLQNFYYQQRFNSSESDEADTVWEYLSQVQVDHLGPWNMEKVLTLFDLEKLSDKSLIKLSNGETRRLALAAALLRNPMLLLMDMPLTGLDVATRNDFDRIISQIIDSDLQVVMTTTPEEIPDSIHCVGLLKDGKMEVLADKGALKELNGLGAGTPLGRNKKLEEILTHYKTRHHDIILSLNRVTIKYGEKKVLDQVDWKVSQGERWLLKGPNGAGKSTLISLVLGENPQAYANDMVLFDRQRGTGESIWDVKRPIGFVSPELSRYFPSNQTCLKVVLSGLFDTMGLFKKVNQEQEDLGYRWLDVFGIAQLASLGLQQVSLEEQRCCLLARAMIKHPQLLVLDEAAQGMDEEMRQYFRSSLEQIIRRTSIAMIYVSHYQEDVPEGVTRSLELEKGKIKQIT